MMRRYTFVLWTLAILLVGLVGVPLPAAAQISRVGPTFPIIAAATRGSAIAYDSKNDVYLVVSSYGTLNGRFINADGTPLAQPFVIQASPNYTHFPRVAYSPDADGGAGGFLVTWHESEGNVPVTHGRIVSITHGLVGPDTRLGSGSWWEVSAPPAVAYSTVSQEFLVVWRTVPYDILAARISNAGTLIGAVFPISATTAYEDYPNVAYNPDANEFLVTYGSYTAFSTLYARRVAPGTGQLLGSPITIQQSASIWSNDVAYDSIKGLFFVAWYQDPPKAIYGRLLNPDGTPAGEITAESTRYAAYDALSLAYNITSGTYFAISHDSRGSEDGGVEIDSAATPLATGVQVTVTGSTVGNFYPRIAAHISRPEWIAVAGGSFAATIGQRLASASRSGRTGTPPPPRPPPTTTQVSLNRTSLVFGAVAGTNAPLTGAQQVRVSFVNGTSTWTVSASAAYVDVSPTSGSGPGSFIVSLKPGKYSAGTDSITITVSAPGAANSPVSLPVRVVTTSVGSLPTGVVDTPADNITGVVGGLAVTGWALDDIGIKAVTVWRDPVAGEIPTAANGKIFIGRAVQVDGARPDVAAATPLPFGYRAGWGYLLLTNMLPNQGNGTVILRVFADDADGHSVLLGSRTITCDNSRAVRPFGAIDTPDQGETISGTAYTNFGWALAPLSKIAADGSTIVVYIDGIPVGNPVYNQHRDDVATLFPGRKNSDGAVGFFQFDTTTLANGVHTIAWSVTDDEGNSEGIGSRYFSVLNSTTTSSLTLDRSSSTQALAGGGPEVRESAGNGADNGKLALTLASIPANEVPIYSRTGFDQRAWLNLVETDALGVAHVRASETGRVALTLGPAATGDGDGYEGYLVAAGKLSPLPAGAFLDRHSGDFFWQPGVGFAGSYDLVFVRTDDGVRRRITVQVAIGN